MTNYEIFTAESFGADCPVNWAEICECLNHEAEERIKRSGLNPDNPEDSRELRDLIDQVWEDYCSGELDYAYIPAPVSNYDGYQGIFWELMGSCSPANAAEIYEYLDGELSRRMRTDDGKRWGIQWTARDIWDEYWDGELEGAPRPEDLSSNDHNLWVGEEIFDESTGTYYRVTKDGFEEMEIDETDEDGNPLSERWVESRNPDMYTFKRILKTKHISFRGRQLI